MFRLVFFGGLVLFLFYQMAQCSRDQAAYDARPDVIAGRERHAAKARAEDFLRKANQDVFDNETPENIAQWERANLAVDPNWSGSWAQKEAEDRAASDQAMATVYADNMRRELRDRPVIVVVQSR